MSNLLRQSGINVPIIQAPMAGGFSTPQLAAAVSNAGGLGSLAGGYLKPEQILEDFRKTRMLTDKPLNINLFAGGYEPKPVPDAGPMLAIVRVIHAGMGLPEPVLPTAQSDPFPSQFEAVLEARPELFSFTFGVPTNEVISRAKQRGILVMGTATTVEEAKVLEDAGVSAVVAQGAEAGAHRGTFLKSFDESMVPTFELVPAIRSAVSIPVIASGGLMDGRDIAKAVALGASAVQLGTIFLPCPEAGTSEPHRRALLSARKDTTVITRAFSGRAARALKNTFIKLVKENVKEDSLLPFPIQNSLTRPMRAAAAKAGNANFLSLWAGQGVMRSRRLPAEELVRQLAEELKEAEAKP